MPPPAIRIRPGEEVPLPERVRIPCPKCDDFVIVRLKVGQTDYECECEGCDTEFECEFYLARETDAVDIKQLKGNRQLTVGREYTFRVVDLDEREQRIVYGIAGEPDIDPRHGDLIAFVFINEKLVGFYNANIKEYDPVRLWAPRSGCVVLVFTAAMLASAVAVAAAVL